MEAAFCVRAQLDVRKLQQLGERGRPGKVQAVRDEDVALFRRLCKSLSGLKDEVMQLYSPVSKNGRFK